MEDIIAQFTKLPPHVRSAVSSPEAITQLEQIENRYGVQLAELVMRVVIKQLPLSQVSQEVSRVGNIPEDKSRLCATDLQHTIFARVANYLGFDPKATPGMATAAQNASLGVDENDGEIAHFAARVTYQDASGKYSVAPLAEELDTQLRLGLDHVMRKRLQKIIESRLVDVRDRMQTREQLMRSQKIGGLGFDDVQADVILKRVDDEYKIIHDKHIVVARMEDNTASPNTRPAMPKIPSAQAETLLPSFEGKKMDVARAHIPPIVPKQIKPEAQPIPPPIVKDKTPVPPVRQEKPALPKVVIPKVVPPIVSPTVSALPPKPPTEVPHFMPRILRETATTARPTVQDIRPKHSLVGPVEELTQMSIEDFRKLDADGSKRALRIREKIEDLEKDSFEERSKGIKGWRVSPIMKEYLSIGRDSMETGKPISQIVQERTASGKSTLTQEEFDSLGALNAALRY